MKGNQLKTETQQQGPREAQIEESFTDVIIVVNKIFTIRALWMSKCSWPSSIIVFRITFFEDHFDEFLELSLTGA